MAGLVRWCILPHKRNVMYTFRDSDATHNRVVFVLHIFFLTRVPTAALNFIVVVDAFLRSIFDAKK